MKESLTMNGLPKMNKIKPSNLGCLGFVLVALVVTVVVSVTLAIGYAKTDTVVLHVTGKESVSDNNQHEYRVYANEGTYKVSDSIVHLRFNAADVYGRIPVVAGGAGGSRPVALKCKVYGWRLPLLSSFKNILECQRV